jgi:hypothetical protein
MSFWSALMGDDAADASRAAAGDTYKKQQDAISGLMGYGDQYANQFQGMYQPYANTGATANSQLQQLMADPSSLRSLPGYQFAQDQGVQALDRSAASRGMLGSGRQSKDLMRFGTGLADQTYGNQFARLMGGAGLGMQATQGQTQGLQGQLGTRQSAYGGQMNAAGTIGQGDIAAANAEAAGASNLFNGAMYLGGKALGGGFNPLSWFQTKKTD